MSRNTAITQQLAYSACRQPFFKQRCPGDAPTMARTLWKGRMAGDIKESFEMT